MDAHVCVSLCRMEFFLSFFFIWLKRLSRVPVHRIPHSEHSTLVMWWCAGQLGKLTSGNDFRNKQTFHMQSTGYVCWWWLAGRWWWCRCWYTCPTHRFHYSSSGTDGRVSHRTDIVLSVLSFRLVPNVAGGDGGGRRGAWCYTHRFLSPPPKKKMRINSNSKWSLIW